MQHDASAKKIQKAYREHRSRSSSPTGKQTKHESKTGAKQFKRDLGSLRPVGIPAACLERPFGLAPELGARRLPEASRVAPLQSAIDVGPDPATTTPDGTPRDLQMLSYDPNEVEATEYGTGVIVRGRTSLRRSIFFNGMLT